MTVAHDISRLSQLDLNLLHVFDVVAREGNLGEAARALSVTQSAVSHALARSQPSPHARQHERLDVPQPTAPEVLHEPLFADAFCVAASRRRGRLSRDGYLAAGHVAVSSRRYGPAMEDFLLSADGVQRRVVVRCRRYETALAIVAATDLLLTLPRQQAIQHRAALPIRLFRTPVPIPAMQVRLYWHRQTDDEPAQQWLRDQLRRCLARPARRGNPAP